MDGLDSEIEKRIERTVGCWTWIGSRDVEGYGRMTAGRKSPKAHRLVYEALVGPIPPGLHLDHLCRNTSCVNPAHLEPVTPRENILRGVGVAALNATKTHCKHGHPLSGQNLYVYAGGRKRACRACCARSHREYRKHGGT